MALSGPDSPGPGVEDLVRRWLLGKRSPHTRTAYATDMARWLSWCDQLHVDPLLVQRAGRETTGVSRSHVEAWARSLEAAGAPATTVARRLSAVSSWYGWLLQGDHVTASPVEHVTRPEVDRDTSATPGMTRAQAAALMAAADTDPHDNAPRTAAIVAVLLYTGLRVGELLGADVDDLGHNRGHRTLTVTRKGGKRAELALPAPATARLDTYLTSRPDLGTPPPLPVTAPSPPSADPAGHSSPPPAGTAPTPAPSGGCYVASPAPAPSSSSYTPGCPRTCCGILSRPCTSTPAVTCATCKTNSATPNPAPLAATTAPARPPRPLPQLHPRHLPRRHHTRHRRPVIPPESSARHPRDSGGITRQLDQLRPGGSRRPGGPGLAVVVGGLQLAQCAFRASSVSWARL